MPKPIQQTGAKPTPVPTRKVKPSVAKSSPNQGILGRIQSIGFDESDGIKMLVYGRSGTGKTTFWSSFPGKILAIICSGSDKPGELRSVDTPENREKIDQVVLDRSEELPALFNYLAESSDYSTVVLDHLSALQDKMLAEMLGIEKVPEQKNWGLASQQTWGHLAASIKELMRSMLSLPQNIVMVAQERTFSGNEENPTTILTPTVGPNLSPGTAAWLCPAVDYIVQTFIRQRTVEKVTKINGPKGPKEMVQKQAIAGEVDFCIRTGPHESFITKFRVPKGTRLPNELVDPDYDTVMALVKGKG